MLYLVYRKAGAYMKNRNILQSIKCASRGIIDCFKHERNFREYTLIALMFLIFNILLSVSIWEYIVFAILICAVFSAEFINTAIERLVDKSSKEISDENKFIKDVSAGGVLSMAIAFFITEGLILIPKLAERY